MSNHGHHASSSAVLIRRDSYLKSPIIELSVGKDDNVTVLHAHQRLLAQSPLLEGKIAALGDAGNVRPYATRSLLSVAMLTLHLASH